MIRRLASTTVALAIALTALVGCDGDGTDGPLTSCDFSFALRDANLKGFGEACTSGSECAYGVCMLPGVTGNITNNQFGFCSRGCDCDNAVASRLTADEKLEYSCVYVSGFQGAKRHVALKCSNTADCTDIAPGYTQCGNPGVGVDNVCLAP